MLFIFRRKPNAADILDSALARRDYRSAATMIAAGALEALNEITAELPAATPAQKTAALTHAVVAAVR